MNMYRDLQESCKITERLLRRSDLTHHPFDTFGEIIEFFDPAYSKFPGPLRGAGRVLIEKLGDLVQTRANRLDEGYPTSRAKQVLDRFTKFMNGSVA